MAPFMFYIMYWEKKRRGKRYGKLIITACICGAEVTKEHNPAVPYTVEEIAEQLCVSKKVAYALVKSGQFAYVRAGRAIRVSKDSFDKWLNQN